MLESEAGYKMTCCRQALEAYLTVAHRHMRLNDARSGVDGGSDRVVCWHQTCKDRGAGGGDKFPKKDNQPWGWIYSLPLLDVTGDLRRLVTIIGPGTMPAKSR